MVSAPRVDGGECFGEFSGGNVRERTNFGCRPECQQNKCRCDWDGVR